MVIPTEVDDSLPRYTVTLLMEMTVIDRDLRFIARWPPTEHGNVIEGNQQFFSVVTAFGLGTA